MERNTVIFIMGVSGCGKTTIGKKLAKKLVFSFYDGDDFHPESNINKMKAGIPLNDEGRKPWLSAINLFAKKHLEKENIVIACSALKSTYRNWLEEGLGPYAMWVFLKGTKEVILQRLKNRKGHFMPVSLLDTQFEILEIPTNAISVDITLSPDEIIEYLTQKLKDHGI
jgi:carbohydrate kinase (thermoresistant glucokinase family)